MSKKFLFIIIISFLFNVFFYTNTFAVVSNSDIVLDVYPKYPKIDEDIRATINSYLINTDNSFYSWSLNNEIKLSGVGKKAFIFKIPNDVTENILSVEIQDVGGKIFNKSITLYGADVDLIWEATDSYSPPFYKGKTLFSKEGDVKVVAIPSIYSTITKMNEHTLSYEWSKDDNKIPFASGFGKNYFTYKNTFLDKRNKIEVIVSDLKNQTQVSNEITIFPSNPKIHFYKKDNIGIKLQETLKNDSFINKEGDTIVAVPYFFSPSFIYSSNLDISWSINNEEIDTKLKDEISIKPESDTSGQSMINVFISNSKTLYQELEKSIMVNY